MSELTYIGRYIDTIDRTDDLISRADAIKEFSCCELNPDGWIDANYVVDFLEQLPSAQPKRGEWVNQHENGHGFWVGTCNQCGKEKHVDNYCPNCGARMTDSEKPNNCERKE